MHVTQFIRITNARTLEPGAPTYQNGDIMRIMKVWENGKGCDAMNAEGNICELFAEEFEPLVETVHSPRHYNLGRVEVIEVIEDVAKSYSDGYLGYCIGNALKYICRAPHKHATPLEDIRKAAKHLDYAINALQQEGK